MVVYLFRKKGENAVKVDAYTGQRVSPHNTALGKAMLAHIPEEESTDIIEYHGMPQTTEQSITNREELFAELQQIREEGVAFDREERLNGLRCVAMPIINKDSEVEGALSISGPTSRMKDERFDEYFPELLQNATNVIELNVTYS